MAFIDPTPHAQVGRVVGNGHCVALVQHPQGARAPHTSHWRPGAAVLGNAEISPGTVIATFTDGAYGNHTDGRSHAALYIGQEDAGFRVVDQWQGHPVAPRLIRDKGGTGLAVDDASRYAVIEA